MFELSYCMSEERSVRLIQYTLPSRLYFYVFFIPFVGITLGCCHSTTLLLNAQPKYPKHLSKLQPLARWQDEWRPSLPGQPHLCNHQGPRGHLTLTEPNQRPTPAAFCWLHHQGTLYPQRSQAPTARCRALIDAFFAHDDDSPTTSQDSAAGMGGAPRPVPRPTPTSTDERRAAGEHTRCSVTQFDVIRGDGGQSRL